MAKEPGNFNSRKSFLGEKFGARRKLKQLQRAVRREEAALGITAPVVVGKGVRPEPDEDLMGEEAFEAEMNKGFKRED